MHDWPHRLHKLGDRGEACVVVTVAGVRGSAPRETGSKMLVTTDGVQGTIGGGQLEHGCIAEARRRLDDPAAPGRALRRFALGSQCGQCCGGVVDVLFEHVAPGAGWVASAFATFRAGGRAALVTALDTRARDDKDCGQRVITVAAIGAVSPVGAGRDALLGDPAMQRALRSAVAPDGRAALVRTRAAHGTAPSLLVEPIGPPPLTVVIFGAGHVGRACAQVLGTLDAAVFVIDSRAEQLQGDWPDNVTAAFIATPTDFVAHCPPDTCYLVMTHDHGVDLDLCREILARPDRRFCGLIGSASKRRRFEKRLRASGYDSAALDSLTCPIGAGGITGKHPGEIAVAVAAQLLTLRRRATEAAADTATRNVTAFPGRAPGGRGAH